jgi:hypothetical protein
VLTSEQIFGAMDTTHFAVKKAHQEEGKVIVRNIASNIPSILYICNKYNLLKESSIEKVFTTRYTQQYFLLFTYLCK